MNCLYTLFMVSGHQLLNTTTMLCTCCYLRTKFWLLHRFNHYNVNIFQRLLDIPHAYNQDRHSNQPFHPKDLPPLPTRKVSWVASALRWQECCSLNCLRSSRHGFMSYPGTPGIAETFIPMQFPQHGHVRTYALPVAMQFLKATFPLAEQKLEAS